MRDQTSIAQHNISNTEPINYKISSIISFKEIYVISTSLPDLLLNIGI